MSSIDSSVRRIAVVKPCCIGDCVMALPVLEALDRHFPYAHIDIWSGSHSRAVFDMSLHADRVVEMDNQPGLAEVPTLAAKLRRESYDDIAILDRSRALRLAARLAGASRVAGACFNVDEQLHESEVYLDVIRALGIPAIAGFPKIVPPATARLAAQRRVTTYPHQFVILQPGGAQNPGVEQLDKRWPIQRWIELARSLAADGAAVVLTGGSNDREAALYVAENANIPADRVLAGTLDLGVSAAVVEHARLFVGIDTGMSHIAAAVGTPTVAIFGPTNPRRYRPLGAHVRVVAPDESWNLRDIDLRRPHVPVVATSIARVDVEHVLHACDSLRSTSRQML